MSKNVILLVESTLLTHDLVEVNALIDEVSAHCRSTEPGMVRYDWFVSPDRRRVRVVEEYVDSDAVRFHVQNYAPYLERMNAVRRIESMLLLGEPDQALVDAMQGRGAEIWAPLTSAAEV